MLRLTLESAQCSDWGGREERGAHARGQPHAQMDPAGGWKVLYAAGLGLVFECESRLRDLGFMVHHSSGASSAKALNMILKTLSDCIFINPIRYC